jgi:glycosyltransferase involved in cell wall biosynthesis
VKPTRSRQRVKYIISSVLPLPAKERAYDVLKFLKRKRVVLGRKLSPLKRWMVRRFGAGARPLGVNLVAYIRAEMGLGEAARGLASALEAADIDFGIVNIEKGNDARHGDLSWARKEMTNPPYDVTVISINPDNHESVLECAPAAVLGARYVVGNWYWELSEFPDKWSSVFTFFDEIWAPSQFIKNAISSKSPVPVVRIPPVVKVYVTAPVRRTLRLPEHRFLFLTMFDVKSIPERKNPIDAVRAYKQAFPCVGDRVGFVLKVSGNEPDHPFMQLLREQLDGRPDIFIRAEMLSRAEVNSLVASCDCFVSLHRSEGFGLGPAEAMYLGKPVIATNWSGNTDYMDSDNSIGISYRLTTLGRDYGPYPAHQQWAEPNIDEAAYWMARISRDEQLARKIGENGRATIVAEYSPEAVGKVIRERLNAIWRYM